MDSLKRPESVVDPSHDDVEEVEAGKGEKKLVEDVSEAGTTQHGKSKLQDARVN